MTNSNREYFSNIAFFDSGQGGLTIWENVVKKIPTLNTCYLGDNARCPYGNKSEEIITKYTQEATNFLISENAKMIIIACGTASSVAANIVKKKHSIPIIGIVEIFCEYISTILQNKNLTVAIIATRFTIKSDRFVHELNKYNIKKIWTKACPLFVPLVEEGISIGNLADAACELYLWDIPSDTQIIMLACTHYPRLSLAIAKTVSKKLNRSVILKTHNGDWTLALIENQLRNPVYLVDASISVIDQIEKFIYQDDELLASVSHKKRKTYCTDSPSQFTSVAKYFSKLPLGNIEMVNVER